jgi:nitrite reductase (NADH) large subunit
VWVAFFLRQATSARSRVLVVGNGMVGQCLLEALSPAAAFAITVIAEEPRPAYDRVQLSAFFPGKTAAGLSLVAADFFERNAITMHLAERAATRGRWFARAGQWDETPCGGLSPSTD